MPSRQANDAVVCMCERSIFSKNHDYNESTEVQILGVIRIQLIVSMFRASIASEFHIDHRSSKADTSTIDLRRSTHQSPIFEG